MLKAEREPAERVTIDGHVILLFFCVGGAALALWLLARFPAVGPQRPATIVLSVLAVGIGLSIAGALGEELRLTLQEQSMGITIEDALEHMLGRIDTASVRAFVQAILQGQTLGVSIGKILRDLAVDMRKRRRQAAEERAHKAPTKILFPLVFLILPALMIVSLGGPLIGLVQNLGSAV